MTVTRFAQAVALASLAAAVWAPAAGAVTVSPNDPSSAELIDAPKKYDGVEITFKGEAITQAMVRGEWAWLHINDDAYYLKNVEEGAELGGQNSGQAVWLPASEAMKVTTFGDYKHEGDVVTIKGTFNAACGEHGGDMDIHARTLTVDIPGRRAMDPVKPWKLAVAGVMVLGAGFVYVVDRRLSRSELMGKRRRR